MESLLNSIINKYRSDDGDFILRSKSEVVRFLEDLCNNNIQVDNALDNRIRLAIRKYKVQLFYVNELCTVNIKNVSDIKNELEEYIKDIRK